MRKHLFFLMVVLMLVVPVTTSAAPLWQQGGEDYVVQADDWLSKLSDKFLGDVLAYPAITYYTNQKNAEDDSYAKISNSNEIEVGWKIYIPSQDEAQAYLTGGAESVGSGTIKIGAVLPLSAPGSVTASKILFSNHF